MTLKIGFKKIKILSNSFNKLKKGAEIKCLNVLCFQKCDVETLFRSLRNNFSVLFTTRNV
jgi:hypothetical protein